MSPLIVHSRTVHVTDPAAGKLASTATALDDGTFCVHCKPGLYQFSVGKLHILVILFPGWACVSSFLTEHQCHKRFQ